MRIRLAILVLGAAAIGCASSPETPGSDPGFPAGAAGSGGPVREGGQPAPDANVAPGRPSPALVEKARAALDGVLADPDSKVRGEALAALGLSGRGDAREKLEAALKEENGELRFGAARGLRLLRDRKAADALAYAWSREKGWAVRKELALAAGACGAVKLVPDLRRALGDANQEVQLAAAFALADLEDPEGRKALARLGNPERKGAPKEGTDRWSRKVLAGEKEGDAALAVRTLAELGSGGDAELLGGRLEGGDATVRAWAAAGILRMSR